LIRERVRASIRRAHLEGQRLSHARLVLNEDDILRDRERGLTLGDLAELRASRNHYSLRPLRRFKKAGAGASASQWKQPIGIAA